MLRRALNIFAGALVILSAFFFMPTLSWAAEEATEEFIAQSAAIVELAGEVEILPQGAAAWQKAVIGMRLTEGDQIRTTEKGRAKLVLLDGSFIKLKEKSTLIVKTLRKNLSSQATQSNLDLRFGEIMVELQKLKPGSNFEVETPTAVAAVRGTTYYVRTGTIMVDGVEKSYVEIFLDSDSLIEYTNIISGESIVLHQGESAIVFDDGTVEGPFPVPPAAQDAWRSDWDMKYDDSDGSKKGMRTPDEEGGGDDVGGDVDDTLGGQDDSQNDANQDQINEQNLFELGSVTIIDSDGDGVPDIEDAFYQDNTIDPDVNFTDLYGIPVTVKGYGSRDELRQAAIDNLLAIQGLRTDISDLLSDIEVRRFEAVKEQIFDHQAAKVMTDRWGNRVRVEEYVSNPTSKQVQILSLNLRTAGSNAGISSFDFRVTFNLDITGRNLRELPWASYMDNPLAGDTNLNLDVDRETQLIVYDQEPTGYPLPELFSLEVKSPYGYAIKATEVYSGINIEPGEASTIWYQYQIQQSSDLAITGINGVKQYTDADRIDDANLNDYWSGDWNETNMFAFLNGYRNVDDESWILGLFYLIGNEGTALPVPSAEDERTYLYEVNGIRDYVNPDFNLEMVFFCSEFQEFSGAERDFFREAAMDAPPWDRAMHNRLSSIDVITIPEITEPYRY